MAAIFWDVVVLAGVASVLGGLWWIYPPVALMCGGLALAGVGVLAARRRKKP